MSLYVQDLRSKTNSLLNGYFARSWRISSSNSGIILSILLKAARMAASRSFPLSAMIFHARSFSTAYFGESESISLAHDWHNQMPLLIELLSFEVIVGSY